ncbi:MAG: hypothetical protein J5533_02630 [Bacteroidales bacterium]|nr:hypothetical protein [Bacteroidales bacterium]
MYPDLAPYYHRWYHERPVIITDSRAQELRRLHGILLKCAKHFPSVWRDYLPLGEKEVDILAEQARHPFKLGTWRPDYIIGTDGSLYLCEITSRFFAHGIFMSWFSHVMLDRFPGMGLHDDFEAMMQKMLQILGGRKRIYVFKSTDKTGEIRLYKRFYEAHGISVIILETPEVEPAIEEWSSPDCFLVSALNQNDILSFGPRTLQAMIDGGMYSDFRNIFLVHDKRFMKLWFDDSFTSGCLTPEETSFLREHAIPTFEAPDVLEELLRHRKDWIIKPWRLGKSEGVHAGVLTSRSEWKEILRHPEGFVAQPFLPQKRYPCKWEGKRYKDYMCGMLLCIDDDYFESGFMRCSSLPVTNIGDNRKAAVFYGGSGAPAKCFDLL